MNTKTERINTVGILTGGFLCLIPFYFYINHFASLKTLAKCGKLRALALTNVILNLLMLPVIFICTFMIAISFISAVGYEATSSSGEFIAQIFGPIIIMFLFSIALLVILIVTAVSTKKFLDSPGSDVLTPQERFVVAKFAGVNLSMIPLYLIIKICTNLDVLKSVDESKHNMAIAYTVLFFISIFGQFIPIVNIFVGFGSIAQFIIGIMLGVQLNDSSFEITHSDEEPLIHGF